MNSFIPGFFAIPALSIPGVFLGWIRGCSGFSWSVWGGNAGFREGGNIPASRISMGWARIYGRSLRCRFLPSGMEFQAVPGAGRKEGRERIPVGSVGTGNSPGSGISRSGKVGSGIIVPESFSLSLSQFSLFLSMDG